MSLCSVCKVKNATGECQKCKNRAYCGSVNILNANSHLFYLKLLLGMSNV